MWRLARIMSSGSRRRIRRVVGQCQPHRLTCTTSPSWHSPSWQHSREFSSQNEGLNGTVSSHGVGGEVKAASDSVWTESSGKKVKAGTGGTLRIGKVILPINAASPDGRADLVPRFYDSGHTRTQEALHTLRWLMQKYSLEQDVYLIGPPGPEKRRIVHRFAELSGRELEFLPLSRDSTESDLKQRAEVTDGTLHYINQPPVRCALNGRILVLEGLEKAERNVLPTLNNLLENREMALDDGRFLVHPKRWEALLRAGHSHQELQDRGLLRVHPDFRVFALGLPVPRFPGYSLDPPLRSRFQSCAVTAGPVASLVEQMRFDFPDLPSDTYMSLALCAQTVFRMSDGKMQAINGKDDGKSNQNSDKLDSFHGGGGSADRLPYFGPFAVSEAVRVLDVLSTFTAESGVNGEVWADRVMALQRRMSQDVALLTTGYPYMFLCDQTQVDMIRDAGKSFGITTPDAQPLKCETDMPTAKASADSILTVETGPDLAGYASVSLPVADAHNSASHHWLDSSALSKTQCWDADSKTVLPYGFPVKVPLMCELDSAGQPADAQKDARPSREWTNGYVRGWGGRGVAEIVEHKNDGHPAMVKEAADLHAPFDTHIRVLTHPARGKSSENAQGVTAKLVDSLKQAVTGENVSPASVQFSAHRVSTQTKNSNSQQDASDGDRKHNSNLDHGSVFIETDYHRKMLSAAALDVVSGRNLCLIGPSGCGKSKLVKQLAHCLGYQEGVSIYHLFLFKDMSSRDLLCQRSTDSRGDTVWRDSALVTAAKEGALCILDGLDRLPAESLNTLSSLLQDRELTLPNGRRLTRYDRFENLCEQYRQSHPQDPPLSSDAVREALQIDPILPSFRLVALALPPQNPKVSAHQAHATADAPDFYRHPLGDKHNGKRWLREECFPMFSFRYMPDLPASQQQALMNTLMQCWTEQGWVAEKSTKPAGQVSSGANNDVSSTQRSTAWVQPHPLVTALLSLSQMLRSLAHGQSAIVERKISQARNPQLAERKAQTGSSGKAHTSLQLSLRQMFYILRHGVRYPEDLRNVVERCVLAEFLPMSVKKQFYAVLNQPQIRDHFPVPDRSFACQQPAGATRTDAGTNSDEDLADQKRGFPIPRSDGPELRIGSVRYFGRKVQPKHPELVPNVHFVNIPEHMRVMQDVLKDFLVGERHVLLIGNQGVGKNKIVDRLLQVLNWEREYMQLHRDTTVQALTLSPTLKQGVVVYEDSSLVKSVKFGRTLVIDEADKAPLEVVAVLKSLVEDHSMRLSDGRQIVPFGGLSAHSHGAATDDRFIEMHPDFRLVILANRPGFPFLGNDFFREIGDVLSCHIVTNPDRESERLLLKSYGPNLSSKVIDQLIDAFEVLRAKEKEGLFQYPYSTRELVNIVKHLHIYPQDGLVRALSNVLSFDMFAPQVMKNLQEAFQQVGIPFYPSVWTGALPPVPLLKTSQLHHLPLPAQVDALSKGGDAGSSHPHPFQNARFPILDRSSHPQSSRRFHIDLGPPSALENWYQSRLNVFSEEVCSFRVPLAPSANAGSVVVDACTVHTQPDAPSAPDSKSNPLNVQASRFIVTLASQPLCVYVSYPQDQYRTYHKLPLDDFFPWGGRGVDTPVTQFLTENTMLLPCAEGSFCVFNPLVGILVHVRPPGVPQKSSRPQDNYIGASKGPDPDQGGRVFQIQTIAVPALGESREMSVLRNTLLKYMSPGFRMPRWGMGGFGGGVAGVVAEWRDKSLPHVDKELFQRTGILLLSFADGNTCRVQCMDLAGAGFLHHQHVYDSPERDAVLQTFGGAHSSARTRMQRAMGNSPASTGQAADSVEMHVSTLGHEVKSDKPQSVSVQRLRSHPSTDGGFLVDLRGDGRVSVVAASANKQELQAQTHLITAATAQTHTAPLSYEMYPHALSSAGAVLSPPQNDSGSDAAPNASSQTQNFLRSSDPLPRRPLHARSSLFGGMLADEDSADASSSTTDTTTASSRKNPLLPQLTGALWPREGKLNSKDQGFYVHDQTPVCHSVCLSGPEGLSGLGAALQSVSLDTARATYLPHLSQSVIPGVFWAVSDPQETHPSDSPQRFPVPCVLVVDWARWAGKVVLLPAHLSVPTDVLMASAAAAAAGGDAGGDVVSNAKRRPDGGSAEDVAESSQFHPSVQWFAERWMRSPARWREGSGGDWQGGAGGSSGADGVLSFLNLRYKKRRFSLHREEKDETTSSGSEEEDTSPSNASGEPVKSMWFDRFLDDPVWSMAPIVKVSPLASPMPADHKQQSSQESSKSKTATQQQQLAFEGITTGHLAITHADGTVRILQTFEPTLDGAKEVWRQLFGRVHRVAGGIEASAEGAQSRRQLAIQLQKETESKTLESLKSSDQKAPDYSPLRMEVLRPADADPPPADMPKEGKVDPTGAPHVGGGTWRGGTGGSNSAGLGGRGGPYRLDAGHSVHQLPDNVKSQVSEQVAQAARAMGKRALLRRLNEIKMGHMEFDLYHKYRQKVAKYVSQLRVVFESAEAKKREREWLRNQMYGDLDDNKLVDAITGEKSVYRRRGKAPPQHGLPQKLPKRLHFVLDVSGSMYRFNGLDGRLERLMEVVIMVMEALDGLGYKYSYKLTGHSGEAPDLPLVDYTNPPKNVKERLQVLEKMFAHAQYSISGDHTVDAINYAVDDITTEDADDYFVLCISDANLNRYGITPQQLARACDRDKKVTVCCLFIASLGNEAQNIVEAMPPNSAFFTQETGELPQLFRQVLASSGMFDEDD